ncbi:MAG: hypothetical protein OER88_00435 [Planctomycetota bacterium]|nr:hypothetical protein [Planctomycetota bacterium]
MSRGTRPAWQRVLAEQDGATVPEPTAPVYDLPEDRAHDPRESLEWFRRMPDHAKEALRNAWREDEGSAVHQKERRRRTRRYYCVEASATFVLLEVLLQGPYWHTVLAAAIFGVVAGGLAGVIRASAPSYGFLFTFFYLLLGLTCGVNHFLYYVLASIIVLCTGAALGRVHTLQKFDGSEL